MKKVRMISYMLLLCLCYLGFTCNKENVAASILVEDVETTEAGTEDKLEEEIINRLLLSDTSIVRGKETYEQLIIVTKDDLTGYRISWKSSDKKIATVDENGYVYAKKAGVAIITCKVVSQSGAMKELQCEFVVTNPKFAAKSYGVAKSSELQLEITGTTTTEYTLLSSDETIVKTYKKQIGLVRGKSVGTATISAIVDGKQIECTVVVSNPTIKNRLFLFKKYEINQIQISGNSGVGKASYSSSNTKIATVSSKGRIYAKKYGTAVITVTVDGKSFDVTASVGKSKAIDALKNAQKVLGATYSQNYRMKKGYYDCSSLVWRSYVPTGITFGYSKYASNAPTAAGEALYLVQKGKAISFSSVNESKLLPGDIIFIASGKNNGRYLNITHVVMYIGNDTIIHATPLNGNCVQYGSYSNYKNTIVCIARPTM